MKQILVVAEIFQGKVQPVTWEIAGAALEIAKFKTDKGYCIDEREDRRNRRENKDIEIKSENTCKHKKNIGTKRSGVIKIIVPGDNPLPAAHEIAKHSLMDVIALKIPGLKTYDSEIYKTCLCRVIRQMEVSHVLTANTSQGRDFAPGLSLKLNAALISGVNAIKSYDKISNVSGAVLQGSGIKSIKWNGKNPVFVRSVLGNTKDMIIRPAPDIPVVIMVMPGEFKSVENLDNNTGGKGHIYISKIPYIVDNSGVSSNQDACLTIPIIIHGRILKKRCENKALKQARIIVAAGRGIGNKEQLSEIFKFAKCFSFSAIGASRPIVDMGWIGYEHQIGITGAKVAPELYIACGISGSSQHLAGMKNSGIVVCINKNPDAPIFRNSDLCIKADLFEFIHEFLKQINSKKKIDDHKGDTSGF